MLKDKQTCDYCGAAFLTKEEIKKQNEKNEYKKSRKKGNELVTQSFKNANKTGLITSCISLLFVVFGIIAFIKIKKFGNYQNLPLEEVLNMLMNAEEIAKNIMIYVALALCCPIIAIIADCVLNINNSQNLLTEMRLKNFDYKCFIREYGVWVKNHTGISDLEATKSRHFLFYTRIVTEKNVKDKYISSTALKAIVMTIGAILIFKGIQLNVESYFSAVILQSKDTFSFFIDFNAYLIIGVIVYILVTVIVGYVLQKEISQKGLYNWICNYNVD